MLTDDEIKAIEARAEVVDAYVGWEQSRRGREVARQDVPALLADRRELLALARELAVALNWVAYHRTCDREHMEQALAKARAAGLLSEGE